MTSGRRSRTRSPRTREPAYLWVAASETERFASAHLNRDEPDRFQRLAERWWDPTGDVRPLHNIDPVRIELIDERAGLAGRGVADVGGGLPADAMFRRGAHVTGIDVGATAIEVARRHARSSGAKLACEQTAVETFGADASPLQRQRASSPAPSSRWGGGPRNRTAALPSFLPLRASDGAAKPAGGRQHLEARARGAHAGVLR